MANRIAVSARRLGRDRHGNTAIEFAFAAPALLLLVFGIIGAGRTMWLQNLLDYAVAEAARCASINPTLCGTTQQIQNFAATEGGGNFDSAIFNVTNPSCGNQVSASYPVAVTMPFFALSYTLSADACYPS